MKYPPLRYHGSKFELAEDIRDRSPQLLPPSQRLAALPAYTHRLVPFAGGLGELMGTIWPMEGISETVNDLSRKVSDFWRCLADQCNSTTFAWKAGLTPFSQDFFDYREDLYQSDYIADRALAFFIEQRMSRQGAGKSFATPTTRVRRGMNEQVSAWLSAVEGLPEVIERLKRVEVRNMDAIDFIRAYDHENAFFYVDPPYVNETRESIGQYNCEMTEVEHAALLSTLASIKGKFLLSGYGCETYYEWQSRYGFNQEFMAVDKKSSGDRATAYEGFWSNYTNYTGPTGEWGTCEKRPIQDTDEARESWLLDNNILGSRQTGVQNKLPYHGR